MLLAHETKDCICSLQEDPLFDTHPSSICQSFFWQGELEFAPSWTSPFACRGLDQAPGTRPSCTVTPLGIQSGTAPCGSPSAKCQRWPYAGVSTSWWKRHRGFLRANLCWEEKQRGLSCRWHHFSRSGFILEALGLEKFSQFVFFLRQETYSLLIEYNCFRQVQTGSLNWVKQL